MHRSNVIESPDMSKLIKVESSIIRRFRISSLFYAAPLALGICLSTASTTAQADDLTYIVQSGDTLWKIANSHLRNPDEWQQLLEYNNIVDQNQLTVGQRLRIPEAWLKTKMTADDNTAKHNQQMVAAAPTQTASQQRLELWMKEANQAMAERDYNRAIRFYTRVLEFPEHQFRQSAMEYLAVAREHKGQRAHARKLYENYLAIYTEGEDAARIKQRLAALISATSEPKKKLRNEKRPSDKAAWVTYGSFSQYYRRDVSETSTERRVNQSSLNTGIDLSARRHSNDRDLRARLTANYDYDLLDHNDDTPLRISTLYFDAVDRNRALSSRIGRQSSSRGGVLGRFDGVILGYQLSPRSKLNVVAGYPVSTSTIDTVNSDTLFYGANLDLGTFADFWDFNLFTIEQRTQEIIDRRAIGGELRYFEANKSLMALIDYDLFFSELNTLLVIANWTLPDKTAFNTVLDLRQSPILTTSNALIGQTAETLDQLQGLYSKQEMIELARDRTADSRSYTLGVSRPLNETYQASGDVTITSLSGTPASGSVEAMADNGNDYFYSLQLAASDLLKAGDFTYLSTRYSNTFSANTTSFLLNSRFPVAAAWRVNPRIRVDYRTYKRDNSKQETLSPSVRVNYRWKRRYHFEIELGKEWVDQQLETGNESSSSYFIDAGYRLDF